MQGAKKSFELSMNPPMIEGRNEKTVLRLICQNAVGGCKYLPYPPQPPPRGVSHKPLSPPVAMSSASLQSLSLAAV